MSPKIKIFIAEQNELVGTGLESILNNIEDFQVVGRSNHLKELVELLQEIQIDIILLNFEMSDLQFLSNTKVSKQNLQSIKVILLGPFWARNRMEEYVAKGAFMYQTTDNSISSLTNKIRESHRQGQQIFS